MAFISNGTTMLDAGAFSVSLGAMTHIKTLTASSSANLTFVHGSASVVLDSTYPVYVFKYINIHPSGNGHFTVNFRDGGSNYSMQAHCAGYFNTTADITAIQFKSSSGNIDAGTIKLYGIKDS